MGDYSVLKQAIANVIKTNGNEEITGQILQDVLLSIVNVVGANATFAGIATPATNPGTQDGNIFYIAAQSGTYPNFDSITVNSGLAIFSNKTGRWTMQILPIATLENEIKTRIVTNRIFSYLNEQNVNLLDFIQDIKIIGLPEKYKISFWLAQRNVNNVWRIYFVYHDEQYPGYVLAHTFDSEKSDLEFEQTIYLEGYQYVIQCKMLVDWTAITSGGNLSGTRENNVVSINNYKLNKIDNSNFDLFDYYDSQVFFKKVSNFFKSIKIIGKYNKRIAPFLIRRNNNGEWRISFIEYGTTTYAFIISLTQEKNNIFYKIDDNNIVELFVDWSVISNGESISLETDNMGIRVSLQCYYPILTDSIYKRIVNNNELTNKKIVVFGDSITALKKENPDGMLQDWTDIIQNRVICDIVNVAIPGARLTQRADLTLTPQNRVAAFAALDVFALVDAWYRGDFSYQDAAVNYLNTLGEDYSATLTLLKNTSIADVDIVIIMAGTNDAQWVRPGNMDDITPYTLYGSVNYIISKIYAAKQSIKIYGISTIVRYFDRISAEQWGDNFIGENGLTLADFNSLLANAYQNNHISFADLYWGLGITQGNFLNYITNDGTHPTYKGIECIANAILLYINSHSDFKVKNNLNNVDFLYNNPNFDILKFTTSPITARRYVNFFKRIRVIGVDLSLRISVFAILRNSNGSWSVRFVKYEPGGTGGYICACNSDQETPLLSGNVTGGGFIEIFVDWDAIPEGVIGFSDRESSRISLEKYEKLY